MKALIFLPLAVMAILTIASVCGLGTGGNGLFETQTYTPDFHDTFGYELEGGDGMLYDSELATHAVCYYNGTPVSGGEDGKIQAYVRSPQFSELAVWNNDTTNPESTLYPLFDENGDWIIWDNLWKTNPDIESTNQFTYVLTNSWGVIALVAVIMGIGMLAGFHFFGGGESEVSVELLLKGSFFTSIWTILSLLAYPLILAVGATTGGFIIYIGYFVLTIIYATGIIMSVKN